MRKTDVVIIGAGPSGIFAAFELGMLGMSAIIIDVLPHDGGQCTALYPEKPIYDIPGFSSVSAIDLIANLKQQAARFNPEYIFGSAVSEIISEDGFIVKTTAGEEVRCKAVVIAAGAGAFGPNRPPLEGIEKYENKSIFYSVQNKGMFADKNVMIAGGGDSAVDWANSLCDTAKKIYMVHRRDKFRAFDASIAQMYDNVKSGKIELLIPYQLAALEGDDIALKAVRISSLNGDEKRIEVDSLLPFFGLKMELGPIANWGLDLDNSLIKVEHSTMQTNRAGIFAVGDIATYKGKLKLILCGFSEGAIAAHAIYHYIYPDKALHFEYSTTKCQDIK